jgi:hypothetical protein
MDEPEQVDELEQSLRTRARPAPTPADLRERILAGTEPRAADVAVRSLRLWRTAALAAACVGAMATVGGTWAGYTHGRSASDPADSPIVQAQAPEQPPALRPQIQTPTSAGTLLRAALRGDIDAALESAAGGIPAPSGPANGTRLPRGWLEGL